MKITKSRLLQIIREEVELHEKNTFELDESFLEELSDTEEKKAIEDEISADEESDVEEDKLFNPKTKKPVNNKTK